MLQVSDFFNSFSSHFHFLRPEWFWGLIPVLIFIIWLNFERKNSGAWQGIIPAYLLKHLVAQQHSSSTKSALALLTFFWILSLVALAGPAWQKIPQPVYEKLQARVYILDLSYSMYAADLKPSRISRARLKLIDLLQNQREGLHALVVYAGDAHVVTPLSSDVNTIISLIPSLEPGIMPSMGSDGLAAINKAISLFTNTRDANAHITGGEIILLTDEISSAQISKIKTLLAQSPYQLSILGVGTEAGAPISLPDGQFFKDSNGNIIMPKLNARELKQLAESSGGRYSDIQKDDSDVHYLQPENNLSSKDQVREVQQNFDIWLEAGYWLLFPIALLGALAFRRGWILSVLILLSLGSYQDALYAQAGNTQENARVPFSFENTWKRLWLNNDQRGLQAFRENEFGQAAESFEHDAWRGSALYKNNQFSEAAESFSKHIANSAADNNISNNEQADNWYNLANALAKSGDFEEALNAYEKSLSFQSEHEDALFNKTLIENLKTEHEKQEQEQEQEQEQDSDKNSETKKQDQSSENADPSQSNENSEKGEEPNKQNPSENNEDAAQQNQQQHDNEQQPQDTSSEQSNEQNAEQQIADQESSENQSTEQQADNEAKQQENRSADEGKDENENMTALEKEQQQALEQWLRQIPDDPSGLLRRKFHLESEKNRQKRQPQNNTSNQQAW